MKNLLLFFIIQLILISNIYAQCYPLQDNSPAFEIDIPDGVQIDSAFLVISNYDATEYVRSRGRSFNNFDGSGWFDEDGSYSILDIILVGPSTADYQVHPALDDFCGRVLDYAKFDWEVKIYCSGLNGNTISYNGNLTDNLANPTNIGTVYSGLNLVSGTIDAVLDGPGVQLYPDHDYDGFGDNNAAPVLFCSEWCGHVANNLDCDDYNRNVNPDASEICNGIDDDCNGSIDEDDPNFLGNPTNYFLGQSNMWHDESNWSLNLIPTICDHVVIPNGTTAILLTGEYGECLSLEVVLGATFEVQIGAEFHAVTE